MIMLYFSPFYWLLPNLHLMGYEPEAVLSETLGIFREEDEFIFHVLGMWITEIREQSLEDWFFLFYFVLFYFN